MQPSVELARENDARPSPVKTGGRFFRELQRFVDRAFQTNQDGPLFSVMRDGTVTRAQLVGYALEYYHVVRLCPGLLAPSLTHCESRLTRDLLQQFFISELNHDRYLEAALRAVGVTRDQLDRLVPLPMTFGVCSSLGALAAHHPLSFKAVLFIFERPTPMFDALLESRSRELGLPAGFYEPMLRHSQINEGGKHVDVTKLLIERGEVSRQDERLAKRHAVMMVDAYAEMERQIVSYYGDPTNPSPRLLER